MGLQIRRRTTGKSMWLNTSFSWEGIGPSRSLKIAKNTTWNTFDTLGNKESRSRLTISLGSGFRYSIY